MKSLVLVMVLVVACGSKQKSEPAPVVTNAAPVAAAPPPPAEPAAPTKPNCDLTSGPCVMQMIHYYEAAMCTCADKACLETVSNDMTAWAQEMASAGDKSPKPNEAQMKEMEELAGQRIGECMTKIMAAEDSAGSGAQ